jgi:predicted nucleic acid-binding protein
MRKPIAVDSGPLVALFDKSDKYHEQSLHFVQHARGELLSNLAVVTEVMYLLSLTESRQDFLKWVHAGAVTLIELQDPDLPRIVELMDKYADLPMDFTDALIVATCERLDLKTIATVDDDFSIYRFKGRGRFENVFFENSA